MPSTMTKQPSDRTKENLEYNALYVICTQSVKCPSRSHAHTHNTHSRLSARCRLIPFPFQFTTLHRDAKAHNIIATECFWAKTARKENGIEKMTNRQDKTRHGRKKKKTWQNDNNKSCALFFFYLNDVACGK